jgi:hypothetical protein
MCEEEERKRERGVAGMVVVGLYDRVKGEMGSFVFALIDHDPDLSCSFQNRQEGHSLPLPVHMKRARADDGYSLNAYGIAVSNSRQVRGQDSDRDVGMSDA